MDKKFKNMHFETLQIKTMHSKYEVCPYKNQRHSLQLQENIFI